jgi:hypothetical protein
MDRLERSHDAAMNSYLNLQLSFRALVASMLSAPEFDSYIVLKRPFSA